MTCGVRRVRGQTVGHRLRRDDEGVAPAQHRGAQALQARPPAGDGVVHGGHQGRGQAGSRKDSGQAVALVGQVEVHDVGPGLPDRASKPAHTARRRSAP